MKNPFDIEAGSRHDTSFKISETYSGRSVSIPIHVRRGPMDGPKLFVTAALHGDELNGTGAIRELLASDQWELARGTLLFAPVLNILAFEAFSRYLPDRRDLNRSFPGAKTGSMASTMARRIFDGIISRCDFGVDLHTAAVRRTNYPNVRANLSNPGCERLATVFGTGIMMDSVGPEGSLRRAATDGGVPTIVVEGGEVWKIEPSVVQCMSRGILNVLKRLEMVEGEPEFPKKQTLIRRAKWVRAQRGGLIQLHVAPGDVVAKGDPIATNCDLLNNQQNTVFAPFGGVVIGCSTLPAVRPGEPIVNIGKFESDRDARLYERRVMRDDVQRITREHLGTNVKIVPSDASEE